LQLVGVSFSYLPFIIFITISTFFVFLLLPETKQKTVDEILEEIKYRARSLNCARCLSSYHKNSDEKKRLLSEYTPTSTGYRSI
uniref:MFS domain-containing protein n=1 Tax=Ascaris lumbricoides TaxID=6252 RepID=A0A0M3HH93_ASCLU